MNLKTLLCFILLISLSVPASAEVIKIYLNDEFKALIDEDGEVYEGKKLAGEIQENGDVFLKNTFTAFVNKYGDMYIGNTLYSSIEEDGEIYMSGLYKGKIEENGDIYIGDELSGYAENMDPEERWKVMAYLVLFARAVR